MVRHFTAATQAFYTSLVSYINLRKGEKLEITCVGVISVSSLPEGGRYDLLVIPYRSSLIELLCVAEIPSSDRASDWIPLSLESGELISKPALANLGNNKNGVELHN